MPEVWIAAYPVPYQKIRLVPERQSANTYYAYVMLVGRIREIKIMNEML